MDQVDYKKKYYDALERMKSWVSGENTECFTEARKAAEFIFPDLKENENENEDERIRKALIEMVHDTTGDNLLDYDLHKEDVLNWLEKQGKVKHTCGNCKTFQDLHQNCPYSPIYKYKDLTEAHKHLNDETNCDFWLGKQVEQEQTELPNGEDYDMDGLYHAARILEKTLGKVEGYQSDDGILEHKCAIEAVKRLYEQKPADKVDTKFNIGDIISKGEGKHSDYPYIPGWRENRPDNKPKIKHSILMLTTHGVAEGEWLGEEWCQYRWSCKIKDTEVLYWLHLSDLETLEKENVKQDFSWIEKQGEEKQDIMFSVGDRIKRSSTGDIATVSEVDVKNKEYRLCNTGFIPFKYAHLWELVEQKPADKDEPKFKVGDWCIDNEDGTIFQIVKVLDNTYTYKTNEGKEYSCSYFALEIDAKLWTIQDVRNGDVLAAHECIVLFKDIDGPNIKCYCTYHFMNNPSFYVDTLQNKDAFHPATKEQRDKLEKAIVNAGYKWDAEKKELKTIK